MTDNKQAAALTAAAKALRKRAEAEVLKKHSMLPENRHTLDVPQARKLMHELRVHQIELEMQNDELQAAQAQLQAVTARYFDLYDMAPVGYLTLDADGVILTANSTATMLLASAGGSLAGQPLTKFILPADQDIFYLHRRQAEKKAATSCELRMMGPDPFWARLESSVHQSHKEACFWRITITNINEARYAQEQLEKSAGDWKNTFDAISDVVWLLDADSRVLRANKATERVFGRQVGELLGLHCYEIAHGTTIPPEGCPLKRAKVTMCRETMELATGGKIFETIVDPIAGADGRFCGAVHVINDITARKKAEEEKQRLLDRLEGKSKELENFIYLTAHDLRTPMVNIDGFSRELSADMKTLREALAGGSPVESAPFQILWGRMAASLGYLTEGAVKMGNMLAGLLQVSRLASQEMRSVIVDMNTVVASVRNSFSWQLRETGGVLEAGALPPCRGDLEAISHVFANLIDNALKYRDRDRKLLVTIKGEAKGGNTVLYSVSDNGRGIKAADVDKIWDMFYRGVNGHTDSNGGEGAGLYLVKSLVIKNGGKIWVKSEEGKGASFFVQLPAPEEAR